MLFANFSGIGISEKELHVQEFQKHLNDKVQYGIVITINNSMR